MRSRKRGIGAGILIDLEMKRQGYSNKTLAEKIGHSEGVIRNARRMDYTEEEGPEISGSVLVDIALGLSLDPQEVVVLACVPPKYRSSLTVQVDTKLRPASMRVAELFEQLSPHMQEVFVDLLTSALTKERLSGESPSETG